MGDVTGAARRVESKEDLETLCAEVHGLLEDGACYPSIVSIEFSIQETTVE